MKDWAERGTATINSVAANVCLAAATGGASTMATPHRRSSSSSGSAIITGVTALVACAAAGGRPHQPFPHAPPPPPGTCQWCGHCCGATEQVVPPWPPTYVMSASTVLMPCNGTGLIDPSSPTAGDFSKWAFASIDWSNGKDGPTVSPGPASQPRQPQPPCLGSDLLPSCWR